MSNRSAVFASAIAAAALVFAPLHSAKAQSAEQTPATTSQTAQPDRNSTLVGGNALSAADPTILKDPASAAVSQQSAPFLERTIAVHIIPTMDYPIQTKPDFVKTDTGLAISFDARNIDELCRTLVTPEKLGFTHPDLVSELISDVLANSPDGDKVVDACAKLAPAKKALEIEFHDELATIYKKLSPLENIIDTCVFSVGNKMSKRRRNACSDAEKAAEPLQIQREGILNIFDRRLMTEMFGPLQGVVSFTGVMQSRWQFPQPLTAKP